MTDTSGITTWLAVIAIASLLQVALIIGAVVAATIAYRRAMAALALMRQQQLDPVVQRVHAVLDDIHDVASRVQSADDQVRHAVSRTAGRVGRVADLAIARFWPVLGVARGVWAAANEMRGRSSADRAATSAPRSGPVRLV